MATFLQVNSKQVNLPTTKQEPTQFKLSVFEFKSKDFYKEQIEPYRAKNEAKIQAYDRAEQAKKAERSYIPTSLINPVREPLRTSLGSDIESKVRQAGGEALVNIVRVESNFNPNAVNKSSGACGLFQRLPCSVTLGDVDGQIANGLAYVNARYGSPEGAWAFWLAHKWY